MSSKFWELAIYDSTSLVWKTKIPLHRLSEAGVGRMLQTLAAKFLSFDEISGALLNGKQGGTASNGLLEVLKSTDQERRLVTYSCGSNPFATARVVTGGGHAN